MSKKPWKEHLEDIKPYQPGKPIEEVKRELGLEDVVKLASNENPLGPPPGVVEAINGAAGSVNRYPDGGCFYLRRALSEKLSLPEENFVFGNGSDEVIVLALHAFVDPGDEVVVADPTFQIYHIASMVKQARLSVVPLKGLKYDMDGMLKAVTEKTKVVFIANPDNPTGSYVTARQMERFLKEVPEQVLVFIDEAYYEFAEGDDYPETLKMLEDENRNIVIARTFSKAYSLAGLRIGYGMARKKVSEVLNKVREPFNVNSVAQAAALAALKDTEHLRKSVGLVRAEKERFYEAFSSMGVDYAPSRTNFILVKTRRDSVKVYKYLLKRGLIVREMTPWRLGGYIRVNIGLPAENDRFFELFAEALKEIPEQK